jgi:hypothetical protein
MAYTIPTSQLSSLIPLLARDVDPTLQQAAIQLLSFRLRPRLADPVWQLMQCEPDCLIYSELMLQLARDVLTAYHGRIAPISNRVSNWLSGPWLSTMANLFWHQILPRQVVII